MIKKQVTARGGGGVVIVVVIVHVIVLRKSTGSLKARRALWRWRRGWFEWQEGCR